MAKRKVLQIGDPRLKKENKLIISFEDPKVQEVIKDLIDTMLANDLIGIAAPQIGENYKIFVTEPRVTKHRALDQTDELRIYINPEIGFCSKNKSVIYEGCGCVANGKLFGPVKRAKEVTIEYLDQTGNKYNLSADGLLGRVIQHEYDHLVGIEFTEKIMDYKRLVNDKFYRKYIRSSEEQVKASAITKKRVIRI